ncbi:MAG: hypothetical protein F6K09_08455 [Merismopedia sp. SIO2A8]|nr:hypothetical protein [Symploca sp. SIO2B6]NET48743.1 hypothetical protein [Merismopedia sp. SIO2A8]
MLKKTIEHGETTSMNPRRTGRLQIGALSEFYEDLLRADSFLANNSIAGQGKSLLQSHLSQKESKIKDRVAYLAKKRNVSFEELWTQIQSGTAEQLTADDYKESQEEVDQLNSSRATEEEDE